MMKFKLGGKITVFSLCVALLLNSCSKSRPRSTTERSVSARIEAKFQSMNLSLPESGFLTAEPGETVNLGGENIRDIRIQVGADPIERIPSITGSLEFQIPSTQKEGLASLSFWQGTIFLKALPLFVKVKPATTPYILGQANDICRDQFYFDSDSKLTQGQNSCISGPLKTCSSTLTLFCLTHIDFPALDLSRLDETTLHSVHNNFLLGPKRGLLVDCDASSTQNCYVDGVASKAVRESDIDFTQVSPDLTLIGKPGTAPVCSTPGSQNCIAKGDFLTGPLCTSGASGCFLPPYVTSTQSLKALDARNLTPGNIKAGVIISGVTGQYPSVAFPMHREDSADDLTIAQFASQLSSSLPFGWFDRNGKRFVASGDLDLANGNLKNGVNIFGFIGTITPPNAWDLRKDVVADGVTGKVPTHCRDAANTSVFDISMPRAVTFNVDDTITLAAHGFNLNDRVRIGYTTLPAATPALSLATEYYVVAPTTDTFKIAITASGTPINITSVGTSVHVMASGQGLSTLDTIDDYNNNGSIPTQNPWPAGSTLCGGMEVTPGDDGIWKDMAAGGCTANPGACRYRDKISGLEWSKVQGTGHTAQAVAACDALSLAGPIDDWRVPTQKELADAYIHGMRSAAHADWITKAQMEGYFYSSTVVTNTTQYQRRARSTGGSVTMGTAANANISANIVCVRP